MEVILILLAVILAIVAVAKVLKAKELVDDLKDPNSDPISAAEIKTNALGWLVYGVVLFTMAVVQLVAFDKYMLPSSASEHGVETDELMKITMILIFTVFFITQGLLFFFGFKYYFRKGKKAYWFPHNNAIEAAWTIIPALVLILLITYGMSTWDNIMNPEEEPDLRVEMVSEQFGWTTRYAGADSTLGEASFALYGSNSVGIATKAAIEARILECAKDTAAARAKMIELETLVADGWNKEEKLDEAETTLKNFRANLIRLNRMLADYEQNPAKYNAGKDDIVINDNRIKLPKGKNIQFQFRSKDVIHSAYMPQFRTQMNTVPGMKTYFTFKPIYTSAEFAQKAVEDGKVYLEIIRDEQTGEVISQVEKLGTTGYVLMCNKICGTSHFNMKVFIDVVEPAEFDAWLADQKTFE